MTAIYVAGTSPFLDRVVDAIDERDRRVEVHRDLDRAPLDRVEALVLIRGAEGVLPPMPRLRFAMSPGAGIDGLLACTGLPSGLPIVRVVDPQQARRMAQYVAAMVLAQWRGLDVLRANQQARRWVRQFPADEAGAPVAVLGYGPLGRATATTLAALGFSVTAWTRSPRDATTDEFRVVSGIDALDRVLARSRFVVVLLPANDDTRGLLDRSRLDRLPRGAYVVNASRASLIDERALYDALASGHLSGAALDVFATEPLPPDSRWWNAPNVTVTPHIAAFPRPGYVAQTLLDTLRRAQAGEALENVAAFSR